VVSVGHLIERKGHDLTIRAMAMLPDVDLVIVGTGPEGGALERLALEVGVATRVRLAGRVAHDTLKDYYSAADVTVLASSREGWANVLLEAMACGAPVVATNIPGTNEVVADPAAGVLVQRSPEAIAAGVRAILEAPPDRAATRAYAERFGWEPTTQGQLDIFRRILAERGRRP
jgi:glycosyltransferase involved in cell wall biosynthesis